MPELKKPSDNQQIVNDLQNILGVKWELDKVLDADSQPTSEAWWEIPADVKTHLMTELVIYVTTHQHKVHAHAYKLGKEAGNGQASTTNN